MSEKAGNMQVDVALVRQLAELLNETGLSEIEVGENDRRIKVARQLHAAPFAMIPTPQNSAAAGSVEPVAPPPASNVNAVRSPMVGTAYLSAEPGAEPFVSVGKTIAAGDTLLIVEAMKVMNPIAAPRGGTVTQVLVDNGQPIEYDQPLVVVE